MPLRSASALVGYENLYEGMGRKQKEEGTMTPVYCEGCGQTLIKDRHSYLDRYDKATGEKKVSYGPRLLVCPDWDEYGWASDKHDGYHWGRLSLFGFLSLNFRKRWIKYGAKYL